LLAFAAPEWEALRLAELVSARLAEEAWSGLDPSAPRQLARLRTPQKEIELRYEMSSTRTVPSIYTPEISSRVREVQIYRTLLAKRNLPQSMLDGCVAVCKLRNTSDCLKLLEPEFRTFPEILGCAPSLQRWLTFTGIYRRSVRA
jgi:hypothetical protein